MNKASVHYFVNTIAKVPLQILLIVPFVLHTVGVVTLVGYFSYRSGQEAVEKLADQLMIEVGDRIDQHLDSYLGKAQEINRINVDAFESGILDLNDFNTLGKYFYRQVQSLNFAYINFGSEKGGFIGAGYGLGNKLDIAEIPISDLSKIRSYSVDNQGNRLKLEYEVKNPQTNNAAWYLDAIKAGKPIWSSIYTWGDLPDHISISASTPVYNQQKKLIGVLGIDLELNQISQFLKKLNSRRSGHIFIIERSGLIVASSEDESPAPIINEQATRLKALNSREPLIHEVTQDLIQRFGSLQPISTDQSFRPDIKQKPFVKVKPYRDKYGLDWLVVTVIPESEFISEIETNANRTILLCGLALIIAIATGSLTAYWIAKPILHLSRSSKAMAKGEWQEPLSENIKIAELQVLATSFNQMSAQIKKSFQESENKFATIFQTTPNPVWIATLAEGRLLNVNESFCQFFGDISEKIVGKTCTQLQLWENIEDRDYLKQTLINEGSILNFKVVIRTAYKKNKTVLMSARVQFLGEEDCLIGVMKDVTDLYEELKLRQQTEATLRESQNFIERITELTPNLLYIYDHIEQRNVYINRCVGEILGYSAAEVQEMGANLFPTICHPDDLNLLYQKMQELYSLQDYESVETEYRVKNAQGQWRWLFSRDMVFSRTVDGKVKQSLGNSQDITDRKQAEIALQEAEANLRKANQELEKLVNTDRLTQIANRRCFDNHLEKEWQRLYREQKPLSLLLLDVDYFKCYNDFYGHQLGDECLFKIAQAVQNVVCRPLDLLARYGGEEFVVILPNTDVQGAIAVADKIHAAIKNLAIPHQESLVNDTITISLGISTIIPTAELSICTLISQADQALYGAKQRGRNQSVIFSG